MDQEFKGRNMKTCKHKVTEFERKFYPNGCGKCYIKSNQSTKRIQPVQGAWSRNAGVERNAHAKDVLQPTNRDGTINRHFVQAHGTRSLQKELKMTDRAIRANAEKYG